MMLILTLFKIVLMGAELGLKSVKGSPSNSRRTRVTVLQYTCQRCGHVWIQQTVDSPIPKSCASCRSAIWTKPKRIAESEAE